MFFGLGKERRWFFFLLSCALHLLFLLLLIFIEPLTSSKYVPSSTFDRAMEVSFLGKYRRILSKPKLSAPSKPKISQIAKQEKVETSKKKITTQKELKQKIKKSEKKKLAKARTKKKKKKITKKLAKIKKKKIKIKSKKKQPVIHKKKLKKPQIALKKLQDQRKKKKRIKLKQIKRVTRKEQPKITSSKVLEQKVKKLDQRRLVKALIKKEKKELVKKIDRIEKKIIKKKRTEPIKKPKVSAHKTKVPKSPIHVKRRDEKLQEKKFTGLKTIVKKTEVKKKEESISHIKLEHVVKVPKAQKSDHAKPPPEKPRKTEEKRELVVLISAKPLFIDKKDAEKLMVAPQIQALTRRLEVPEIKQEAVDFDAHAPPKLADKAKELHRPLTELTLDPEKKFKVTEKEPTYSESDKILEKPAETAAKKDIEKEREFALAEIDKLPIKLKTEEKEKKYQTAKSLKERKFELAEADLEIAQLEEQKTQLEIQAVSKELYKKIKPKYPLGPEEKYKITQTTHLEADKILEKSAQATAKKDIGKERELALAETDKLPIKIKTEEKEKDYQTAKSLNERKLELAEGDIEVTQLESRESQPELQATSSKVEVDTSDTAGSFKELIEKVQLEQDDKYYEKLADRSIMDWLEEEMEEEREEKSFALEEETSAIEKPKFTPIETEKVEIASLSKAHKATKISLEALIAGKSGRAGEPGARKVKSGSAMGAYITVNLPFSNMTQTPWFKLTGHVVNLSTDKLYLTLNGVSQVVPVVNSAFAVQLDLSRGVNKISLLALSNINNLTAKKDAQILYSVPVNLPSIFLSLPIDGTQGLKEGDTIIVEGNVDDASIKKAVLFFNKRPIRIRVDKGRFHKKVYMTAGRIATLRVMALTNKRIKIYSRMHTVLSGYDVDDMINPRPY